MKAINKLINSHLTNQEVTEVNDFIGKVQIAIIELMISTERVNINSIEWSNDTVSKIGFSLDGETISIKLSENKVYVITEIFTNVKINGETICRKRHYEHRIPQKMST